MAETTTSTLSIRAILRDEISKGLEGIRGRLVGVKDQAVKLGAEFSPVLGKIAAGFAAVAAVAGFQSSIAAARDAVNAEARLLSALKGRREELERIKSVAEQIQNNSLFEDDELIAQAATLVAMGNAASKIPDQLQAAADVAAQFGLELNETVRAIGLFRTGEFGRLGTKVPILQKLKEEGRLATDGVSELLRLFGGAAAAQAANDFGTIAKLEHQIGNEAERIGSVLAKIQASVLRGILSTVQAIADALSSKAGTTIVEIIADAAPQLAVASAAIGAIVAGFVTWAAVGKPVIAAVSTIFKIVTGVGGILGTIVKTVVVVGARLFPWIAILSVVVKLLDGMLFTQEELAEKGGLIARGFQLAKDILAKIADFFSFIVEHASEIGVLLEASFEIAGAAFNRFVATPISDFFKSFGEVLEAVGSLIANTFKLAIAKGFEAGFQLAIPSGTNRILRDVLVGQFSSIIGGETGKIAKAIDDDVSRIDKALSGAFADTKRSVEDFDADLQRIGSDAFDSIEAIGDAQRKADTDALNRAEFRVLSLKSERDGILAEVDALRSLRAAIAQLDDLSAIDPDRLRGLLRTVDDSSGTALAEIVRSRINRAVELGTIDVTKALELIRVLEVSRAERNVELAQKKVDLARLEAESSKGILENALATAETMRAQGATQKEITDFLAKQGDLQAGSIEDQQALLDAERELAVATGDAAKAQERFAEATSKAAGTVLDRAQDARKELDQALKRSAELQKTGAISDATAVDQQRQALERFAAVMVKIRSELDAIKTKFPELGVEVDRVRAKIDDLEEGIQTLDASSDDFVGGFKEGLRQGASQLNDLKELGQETGKTLADALGEGVIDVFVRGRKTFREWVSDVLFGLAELFAKFAAFKAISAALDLSGQGLADGVAANVNVTAAKVSVNGAGVESATAGVTDALTSDEEGGFLSTITSGISDAFSSIGDFFGFGGGGDTAAVPGEQEAGFLSKLGSFFGIGQEGSFISSITSGIAGLFTGGGPLSFLGTLGSGLVSGGSALLGGLGTVGSSALSGLGALGTGAMSLLGPALAPLTGGLSALLPAVMPMLSGLLEPLMSGLTSIIPQLLGPLLGSITSFLPALLGGAGFGGLFEGLLSLAPLLLLADGGPVPGPWTGRDDRVIGVGGEEYVHPAKATRYYGLAAMDAIRRRAIPREVFAAWSSGGIASIVAKGGFAEGGAVSRAGAHRRGEGDQVVRAIIAPTEEGADALFKSGRRPLLDFISAHKSTIKTLLNAE